MREPSGTKRCPRGRRGLVRLGSADLLSGGPQSSRMTFAVVPAAGHSTRMGQPKLSLRLGGRTVIECVVSALRAGGVQHVVVVIGPHVGDLAAPATLAGADVCLLPEPTPDMRSTVEYGLRWLEQTHAPGPDDFWLLAPADHPT